LGTKNAIAPIRIPINTVLKIDLVMLF